MRVSLSFKEKFFLAAAIAYAIFGFTCVSLVSAPIVKYISQHGWKTFNGYFLPFLTFLLGLVVGFLVSRLWVCIPDWWQISFVLAGAVASVYGIRHTMLLTTELIHIPQFTIATLLFCAAFPRNLPAALACSAALCIGDEWTQSFFPNRVLDLNDILLNFIGLYIGWVVWWGASVRMKENAPVSQ